MHKFRNVGDVGCEGTEASDRGALSFRVSEPKWGERVEQEKDKTEQEATAPSTRVQ